jgi:uncharacterized protein YjbI with pentapeptide repeats
MSEVYRPTLEREKLKKVTREEVEAMLERGEDLENLDLKDLDLTGLNCEGKSFRGSDIRGIYFYGLEGNKEGNTVERITILRHADFTDTTIGDFGPETIFGRVEAEGAVFGFSESLISRRNRHTEMKNAGIIPEADDTGALYNFNGSGGNFVKTKWKNVDFGGETGCEAFFAGADMSEAEIVGSDLSGLDWSTVKIYGIKIKDPLSLQGLIIAEQQADTLAQTIEISSEKERLEFAEEIKQKGPRGALEDYFGVIIN